jgi:hypothetical protein
MFAFVSRESVAVDWDLRVGLDAAKRKIPSCGESIPN